MSACPITLTEVLALRQAGRCTHVAFVRNAGFAHGSQYFDAAKTRIGLIQRAPTRDHVNVKLKETGRLVTTRLVKINQELFMPYGSSFVL